MRYNIIAFFILIATVLSAWIASAEEITTQGVATKSADELWTEAERAYREGEFAEAVVAYEAIIAQGMESAELYYNLGNAYFKQNNLGRSILFYNRAQLLNPSDEDVRHNLMYARTKTKDNIQLSMFQLDDPVLIAIRDKIKGLDIDSLTPLEALNKLNDIKRIAGI